MPDSQRRAVATSIDGQMEAAEADGRITIRPVVYDHPPDLAALPAVVILPDDPYWTVGGYGAGASNIIIRLTAEILVDRTDPQTALTRLEQYAVEVAGGLPDGWDWLEVSGPSEVTIADTTALMVGVSASARIYTDPT